MATSPRKLTLWASILGLNTLVFPPFIHAATYGSHTGDGSQLSISDNDTIQADQVTPSEILYGLHTDINQSSTFDLKNNVTISVGDHPTAKYSFGIAVNEPAVTVSAQKLSINVDRQETGKAAGISHFSLSSPSTAQPVTLNLGEGSTIHVKGSGPAPSSGSIPNLGGYNNYALGIGIWNQELNLSATKLTLNVESVHGNAYGLSKSVGNDLSHTIDLGKDSYIYAKAGNDAYGVNIESTITSTTLQPRFSADALTVHAQGGGATAFSVSANNGLSHIDLGRNSQLIATGTYAATALNLKGPTQFRATDLTLSSQGTTNNVRALLMNGLGNRADFLGTTQITSSRMGAYVYGVRSGSSPLTTSSQLNFEQVHIKAKDYGLNIQGRVDLNLGTGSTIESSDLAGIWLIANRSLDAGANITMQANALDITVTGPKAVGLDVRGNATAHLNAGSKVQTGEGTGLYADDSGQIFFTGNASASNFITAQKTAAHATKNGKITLQHTTIGLERAADANSGVAAAVAASNKGLVDGSDVSVFYVSQENNHPNYVVYANNGTVNLNNLTFNTTGSSDTADIVGIKASAGGKVVTTGELYANMHSPTATAFAAQDANSFIHADGNLHIYGSASAINNGRVRVDMSPGSTWLGSATQTNNGIIDVALLQSLWTPVSTSRVNELSLTQKSTLDLRQLPTDGTLTVDGRLQGSKEPAIHFRPRISPTNPANFDTRLIVNNAAGTSQGNFEVHIANDGAFNTQSQKGWTIVNTTGQPPSNLKFYSPHAIELGGYLYKVAPHENGRDWQVASLGDDPLPPKPNPDEGSYYEPLDPEPPVDPWNPPVIDPNVTPPVDPVEPPNPPPPVEPPIDPRVDPPVQPPITPTKPEPKVDPSIPITTTAKAAANMLASGYLLNLAEQQTLMQRMGDLRLNGEHLHNFWMRGYGGHYNNFSYRKLDGFKMDYYGMQVGLDSRLGDLPVYTGVFVGYTHGDPKPTEGSANAKSYHGGIYATYIDENSGIYVDGVLKYSRFKHDFSVTDTEKQRIRGDTSTHGLSASVEVGKRFHFNAPKQGWYIEPHAQHTFSHVNSADFTASNGLNIHLDSYNSNIGRYGFALGYEMTDSKTEYNLYWKTGFVREFSGRTHYYLNGSKEDHSFRGNWWNNGLGINARINQRHDFYLELDTNYGSKFNNVNVTGGYRLIF